MTAQDNDAQFDAASPDLTNDSDLSRQLTDGGSNSNDLNAQSPGDTRGGKRRLFGFGKRRNESADQDTGINTLGSASKSTMLASSSPPVLPALPPQPDFQPFEGSPTTAYPSAAAVAEAAAYQQRSSPPPVQAPSVLDPAASHPLPTSSPHLDSAAPQHIQRSPSPHLDSVASSSIFERNVQESALPSELAPAIPNHIQTEEHIPPVLEAASLAITDNHLGPDEVQIVTHSAHQPAVANVADPTLSAMQSESHLSLAPSDALADSSHLSSPHADSDDTASNYGTLNPNDVRRLSFISFADVVHGEQAADSGSRDGLHHMAKSATSLGRGRTHSPSLYRSPSPVRSPQESTLSTHGIIGTPSPPHATTGLSPNRDIDSSPGQSPPIASGGHQHSELTIETMRQALRKTASGDLSTARSIHGSGVGGDE